MCFNSTATTFTRLCTIRLESRWFANTWNQEWTWNTCLESASNRTYFGSKKNLRKWSFLSSALLHICRASVWRTEILNQQICFCFRHAKLSWLTLENRRIIYQSKMMAGLVQWQRLEAHPNTYRLFYGERMWRKVATLDTPSTICSNRMSSLWAWSCSNLRAWRTLLVLTKKTQLMTARCSLLKVSSIWDRSIPNNSLESLRWCLFSMRVSDLHSSSWVSWYWLTTLCKHPVDKVRRAKWTRRNLCLNKANFKRLIRLIYWHKESCLDLTPIKTIYTSIWLRKCCGLSLEAIGLRNCTLKVVRSSSNGDW